MSDIIKVKVVKSLLEGYWYSGDIGKTFLVLPSAHAGKYKLAGNFSLLIDEGDCVVVPTSQTLQERLQQAKAAVEEIEKEIAEEAEKEASRPFKQAEYEKVVAEYRGCHGRQAFTAGSYNYVVEICEDRDVDTERWIHVTSCAPFGVVFSSEDFAKQAIAKVGAENLKRAWAYEMLIGLKGSE